MHAHPQNLTALLSTTVLLCGLTLTVGCTSQTTGPNPAGQAVLLETEPADAMGIVATKGQLLTGLAGDTQVIVGRAGDGRGAAWDAKQATFLLRDLDLQSEAHDHAGHQDNCKFCQAEKAKELESMTLVRVVDGQGQVMSGDAQGLLGIKDDQVIVATGSGTIDESGTFIFDATKIFVRP